VIIKEKKYDHKKHKFVEAVDSSGIGIILVDGKEAYGLDYGSKEESLSREIDYIDIINKSKKYRISRKYYSNWFNANIYPNKRSLNVFVLPYNRIIIDFMGSDAAGSYRAALIIKDNKVIKKLEVAGAW